jgi:hypothetical protein
VADVDVPPAGAFCWVGSDCHVTLTESKRGCPTCRQRASWRPSEFWVRGVKVRSTL